ncbi:hypothetical protein ACFY2Q_02835 [Micromonospora sp. NPDC000316]|uniref:hypothetical protein n=1 Tax=Micromonospora sp. NPDC000316 TaxID=3364216 RepID=UPI00367A2523
MSVEPAAARAPLGRRARTCVAVVIVLAVVVPALLIRELTEAWFGAGPVADVSSLVVPVVMTAWLAPYASYRRRDALLWLVGPGLLIFAVIAWRVAFAPYRDWRPRPDEVARVRWLRDPERAGMWYVAKAEPNAG